MLFAIIAFNAILATATAISLVVQAAENMPCKV